jgi:hypothetical protein
MAGPDDHRSKCSAMDGNQEFVIAVPDSLKPKYAAPRPQQHASPHSLFATIFRRKLGRLLSQPQGNTVLFNREPYEEV